VLLGTDGPRVIDFGIARAADTTALTRTGVTAGTPAFMAPEQAMAQPVTPAADIFALGLIAVFVTAGSPPFGDGSSPAVLYRIVHEEPDLSGVPAELREVVTRCLAKNPADRPSPAEVVRMCRPLTDGAPLPAEGWLPPAVSAEIDQHARTVTSLAAQPAASFGPPPRPAAFPTAASAAPAHTPPGGQGPQTRGRGRNVLLAAVAVVAVLAGVGIGAMLMSGGGDEGPGTDDSAGDGTSRTPTGSDPTPDDEETGSSPPETPAETTPEAPAEPEPAVYEDLSISHGYIIWLYEDPPRPVDSEIGPGYEGDFGYLGSDLILDPHLLTDDDNTMALLRQDETGSLDTCRSVTRYTDRLFIQEEAPPGSEICLTTATGDIGLVTVKEFTPEYVTIDLTVWRGAAQ
ncbi:serine/threonine-protein kinase, partial [Streptomyces hainanensis]